MTIIIVITGKKAAKNIDNGYFRRRPPEDLGLSAKIGLRYCPATFNWATIKRSGTRERFLLRFYPPDVRQSADDVLRSIGTLRW